MSGFWAAVCRSPAPNCTGFPVPADMKKGPAGPFTTQLSGRGGCLFGRRLHCLDPPRPGASTDERTPPEANTEYSRGLGLRAARPRRARSRSAGSPRCRSRRPRAGALARSALLGALLLLVAEFTALYHVHTATSRPRSGPSAPAPTTPTRWSRSRSSRPSLRVSPCTAAAAGRRWSAIGALGDRHAADRAARRPARRARERADRLERRRLRRRPARARAPGLYMETLGAVVLLIIGGVRLPACSAPASGPRAARAGREPPTSRVEQAV